MVAASGAFVESKGTASTATVLDFKGLTRGAVMAVGMVTVLPGTRSTDHGPVMPENPEGGQRRTEYLPIADLDDNPIVIGTFCPLRNKESLTLSRTVAAAGRYNRDVHSSSSLA